MKLNDLPQCYPNFFCSKANEMILISLVLNPTLPSQYPLF